MIHVHTFCHKMIQMQNEVSKMQVTNTVIVVQFLPIHLVQSLMKGQEM